MSPQLSIDLWAKRYSHKLRLHLEKGAAVGLPLAWKLGGEAAALGMETLDVARIHEQALKMLVMPSGKDRARHRMIEQAKNFFEEVLVPIEQTHAAAKDDVLRVAQVGEQLRQKTAESMASTRRLQRDVVRRKAAEATLDQSGRRHVRLVKESRVLEGRLHEQMGQILAAQEKERQRTSQELQNEIAQILLAIHLRLLTLKEAAKANTVSLKKEIAETQVLVKQSVLAIRRLSHEASIHHED